MEPKHEERVPERHNTFHEKLTKALKYPHASEFLYYTYLNPVMRHHFAKLKEIYILNKQGRSIVETQELMHRSLPSYPSTTTPLAILYKIRDTLGDGVDDAGNPRWRTGVGYEEVPEVLIRSDRASLPKYENTIGT